MHTPLSPAELYAFVSDRIMLTIGSLACIRHACSAEKDI